MRIVFLSRKYCRGEAWCNRLLAYARGFKTNGCNILLLFLIDNEISANANEDFAGLDVQYISKFSDHDRKFVKLIKYSIALSKANKFINKGDVIFTSDGGELFLPFLYKHRKSNYVFSEISEHPDIFGLGTNLHGIKGYIKKKIHSLKVGLNNILIRNLSGLFVISTGLRNYFISHGVDSDIICKVNMFVDTSRFRVPKEGNGCYIAYCGTMSINKDGVDVLIKAFNKFHSEFPEYKLYLIGPYQNQKTRDVIEMLIASLNLQASIVLTGKVSPTQMPYLLMNASILALSRPDNIQNRNGFPTKLGEYLATGNPVAVTSIGDIPDYLKDEVNAYLAVPGDVDSFANALLRIARNYDAAKKVGENGYNLVHTVFSSKVQTSIALNHIKERIVK